MNGKVQSVAYQSIWASSLLCLFASGPLLAAPMTGAYIPGDGWNTTRISEFKQDGNTGLAVVNLFTSFDYTWSNQLKYQASNIVSQQATPMITLMPVISARRVNLLGEITAGEWDSYLDTWIAGLKSWQGKYPSNQTPTVLLRFAHEFNGNWYPWGNDPNGLRAAWRYVHARFAAAGVSNVEWVWCANNVDVDSYNDVTRYYPGDDVVDWTGLDGYNWGSNYSFSRWKSFDETFSVPYVKLVTNFVNKPVLLAEVASAEPSDTPRSSYGQNGNNSDANESKSAWVAEMYGRIPSDYPAIQAVSWFNINKELSWSLNSTAQNGQANTGMDAYRQVMSQQIYSGQFTPLSTGMTAWVSPHQRRVQRQLRRMSQPQSTSWLAWLNDQWDQWDQWSTNSVSSTSSAALACRSERVPALARLPVQVGHSVLAQERAGLLALPAQARAARLQQSLDLITSTVVAGQ